MRSKRSVTYRILGLVLWLCCMAAGQALVVAQSPEPLPSPETTPVLERRQATPSPLPDVSPPATLEDTAGASESNTTAEATGEVATPEPTPTGLLEGIDRFLRSRRDGSSSGSPGLCLSKGSAGLPFSA
jgi:hypothetical protein